MIEKKKEGPKSEEKPKMGMIQKFWLIVRALIGIMLLDRWLFKPARKAIERPGPLFQLNNGVPPPPTAFEKVGTGAKKINRADGHGDTSDRNYCHTCGGLLRAVLPRSATKS